MHWDFALILLFLATVVPLLGRRRIRRLMEASSTTKADRLILYASTIAFQWIAVALILWRTYAHHLSPASLGLAIPKPGLALITAILLSALVLVNQIVALRRLKEHPESSSHGILPHLALKIFPQDTVERLGFTALVSTVAICEELIYRGFAQRVFQDWSTNWVGATIAVGVGVVGSAVMFSLAHLYQGRRGADRYIRSGSAIFDCPRLYWESRSGLRGSLRGGYYGWLPGPGSPSRRACGISVDGIRFGQNTTVIVYE